MGGTLLVIFDFWMDNCLVVDNFDRVILLIIVYAPTDCLRV